MRFHLDLEVAHAISFTVNSRSTIASNFRNTSFILSNSSVEIGVGLAISRMNFSASIPLNIGVSLIWVAINEDFPEDTKSTHQIPVDLIKKDPPTEQPSVIPTHPFSIQHLSPTPATGGRACRAVFSQRRAAWVFERSRGSPDFLGKESF